MMQFLQSISKLSNQWLGTGLFELSMLFLAILLCIFVLVLFWDRALSLMSVCIGICFSVLLMSQALWYNINIDQTGLSNESVRVLALFIFTVAIVLVIFFYGRTKTIKYGTTLTAPLLIVLAVSGVLMTGMLAPHVMIGDEVTHYFMMKTQVGKLPTPNFFAEIPNGWGGFEIRRYPHSFFWHYLGALVYFISGGSFFFTQLYQSFFLAQLLVVAYLLACSRRGAETRSALIYLLLIVSLPMTLIFSVAFYQDIPMTAQILTAFYCLRKNKWILASLFMCFALGLKVTAILFFPMFFVCLLVWTKRSKSMVSTVLISVFSVILVGSFTFGFGKVIHKYSYIPFYPVVKAEQIINQLGKSFGIQKNITFDRQKEKNGEVSAAPGEKDILSPTPAKIIANHPGDLRVKSNFVVYGGLLLYLAFGGASMIAVYQLSGKGRSLLQSESSFWLWGIGVSYILMVAWLLKSAPDARFFLPGIMFCMLPIAERLTCLSKSRWLVILFTVLAIMQSGYSLAKIYTLRTVTPDIQGAIEYLQQTPPNPRSVFMYPEGSYRLFPVPHEWYLQYHLRDFWRADNTERIIMLNNYSVGAVLVKKHLIAHVDEKITDLGVYPDFFILEIESDSRFEKVFENGSVIIYKIPYLGGAGIEIK